MTTTTAQRDHIDLFLDRLVDIPGLDPEVEGIVDRINSLRNKFRRALEETLGEHDLTWGEWKVLGSLILGEGECSLAGRALDRARGVHGGDDEPARPPRAGRPDPARARP